MEIPDKDLEIKFCRGSGKGGQHRNKTDTACQIKHRPTGLQVRCESERSQSLNKELALSLLHLRLKERLNTADRDRRERNRKQQVGSGQRGDKRRTIRMQDDQVVDHVTGKRMKASRYLRGYVEELQC